MDTLRQLFLLHTARANPIFYDFLTNEFWAQYHAGAPAIKKEHAFKFIQMAQSQGRIAKPWSILMQDRMANYLCACLTDFGLTTDTPRNGKQIKPFKLLNSTALYLAHDIHFAGISDNGILDFPDWKLFGLDRSGVLEELKKLDSKGYYILQYSGELLRISWKFQTMEECLDGITE